MNILAGKSEKTEGWERYIDVLDGVRAIALLMVVWFHIWEQSWLTPYIEFNPVVTRYIGINRFDLHVFVQCGYILVEMLILISAVVNFLPYARSMVLGEPWPDQKNFYKKRAIRVLPSYFLCVFIMFLGALVGGSYGDDWKFMIKDLLTHLTFTSTFFSDTYRITKLNGALWTVQVEVIWYLLIPYIALFFKRFPALTTGVLYLVGILSSNILLTHAHDLWVCNNFFLTFAEFYANGMLICMLYLMIKKAKLENRYTRLAGVLVMVGAFLAYVNVGYQFLEMDRPYAQLAKRLSLSLIMSLFILGVMFTYPAIKAFFKNPVFRFISIIAYNLYIWHQVIAAFLKDHRIPYWTGETPPNELNDIPWMRKYFVLALVVSMAVPTLVTYFFEKPVSKYLTERFSKERPPREKAPREKTFRFKKETKTAHSAADGLRTAMKTAVKTGEEGQPEPRTETEEHDG